MTTPLFPLEGHQIRPSSAERATITASMYCEELEKMPQAAGYLPTPFFKQRGRSLHWTPQTLRRAVEAHICECASEAHHQALAVYRDHGVPLAIFERYDAYLDDKLLYENTAQTILKGKANFPDPLKPVGMAILAYGRNFKNNSNEPFISEDDFQETMDILRSMGAHSYQSQPQYVAMMFTGMSDVNFIPAKNKEKMVTAISYFLDNGGVSLCRSEDAELTFDESVQECFRSIKQLEKKLPSYNKILDFAMEAEAKNGFRDFIPSLVFSRFLNTLKYAHPEDVAHIRNTTNLREIFERMHDLSPLERTPSEIVLGRRTDFTPLRLLKAIDQSRPPKNDATFTERLFESAVYAGMNVFTADPKHMLNLIRHYGMEGALNVESHTAFNAALNKVVGSLSLDGAVKLAESSSLKTRRVALDQAKNLLDANKKEELAAASDKTIEILFRSQEGEKFRKHLGLDQKDAFLNKGKITRSMSFRADSFSKDLGL